MWGFEPGGVACEFGGVRRAWGSGMSSRAGGGGDGSIRKGGRGVVRILSF